MGVVVEPSYARFWLLCRDMSNNSLSGQIPKSFGRLDLFFMWVEKCIRYMCELKYTIAMNARDHTSMYQTLHIPLYWSPWSRGDVDTFSFFKALWHREDTENNSLWVFSLQISEWQFVGWRHPRHLGELHKFDRFVSVMMWWECEGLWTLMMMMFACSVEFIA